jgi:hypothetical protein
MVNLNSFCGQFEEIRSFLLLKVEWSEQITGSGQSQMKQSFVL